MPFGKLAVVSWLVFCCLWYLNLRDTSLHKNRNNVLNMLTPLCSHYYSPTCFSPQGVILRCTDNFVIRYLCCRMLYVTIALLSLLTYAVRCHCIISADVFRTLPLHCYLCWRMLYVSIALSLLTYDVRYHCLFISADVFCTLLLHCYLSWRMLYVTIQGYQIS